MFYFFRINIFFFLVEGILRELVSGENGGGNSGERKKNNSLLSKDGSGSGSGGGVGDNNNNTQSTSEQSGLYLQEVETWCADFRQVKKSETAMNEQRMVLQVYRDSFETDMKAMNGEGGKQLKSLNSSIKMIGSSSGSSSGNGGSPEKEHNTTSTSSIHPMSPSSGMIDSNGSLPPQRMKVILEQAHGKLGTLLLLLCFLLHDCFCCIETCQILHYIYELSSLMVYTLLFFLHFLIMNTFLITMNTLHYRYIKK